MSHHESTTRSLGTAVRMLLLLTLVLGVLYPVVITVVAQIGFRSQADGSFVRDRMGTVVGSRLIGQSFTADDGTPLPQYFQPRPSAAGEGYDAASSSGSNLGPESPDLINAIRERRRQIAEFNSVSEDDVPPDAVTASGSGLDPDISPAYAALQVERVASQRGLPPDVVRRLVATHTHGPDLGFIGEPRVNVVELNLALDQLR